MLLWNENRVESVTAAVEAPGAEDRDELRAQCRAALKHPDLRSERCVFP
jgi:hypothetical protein